MFVSGKTTFGLVAGVATVLLTAGAGSASAADSDWDGHYYGAFAISTDNPTGGTIIGMTGDYPNQGEADANALSACGYGNCFVVLRYMDGCGSLAERDGLFLGGVGPTPAAAEGAAIGAFGPPRPASLSAEPSPTRIVDTRCN
ncbi:DUF4189 domain-containing protein [Nocardia sp. alder85J]|uniref:DUF4189 domain-containing protein n=1 Tax=Nocardia sp. alder85J TaxID=2862949 RepID=UPI001CD33CA0|nr:DUF4189 domain-containing protein [Nocardia sp. alder85J]MCX4099009.1 DUF4189 domain-containing protein [Nocardia sp. alder85J]